MHVLIEILVDIGVYLEPQLLKKEFAGKIDQTRVNRKKLEEYRLLLNSIKDVFEKILKYELYFAELYSSSRKISDIDVLEHHIHAYLQDLTILKNKIIVFLNVLKNDLKKVASNGKDISQSLAVCVQKIENVFAKVSQARHPHSHRGNKFYDRNLLSAQMFKNFLDSEVLHNLVKPELIEEMKVTQQESFQKAKTNWISVAQNNNKCLPKFLDDVFLRIKGLTYKFLHITSVKLLTDTGRKKSS